MNDRALRRSKVRWTRGKVATVSVCNLMKKGGWKVVAVETIKQVGASMVADVLGGEDIDLQLSSAGELSRFSSLSSLSGGSDAALTQQLFFL